MLHEGQLQVLTNQQQRAAYRQLHVMRVLCSIVLTHFLAGCSYRDKSEPCKTLSLLARIERDNSSTYCKHSSYNALTVLVLHKLYIVFPQQCCYGICNYCWVSQGHRRALGNSSRQAFWLCPHPGDRGAAAEGGIKMKTRTACAALGWHCSALGATHSLPQLLHPQQQEMGMETLRDFIQPAPCLVRD